MSRAGSCGKAMKMVENLDVFRIKLAVNNCIINISSPPSPQNLAYFFQIIIIFSRLYTKESGGFPVLLSYMAPFIYIFTPKSFILKSRTRRDSPQRGRTLSGSVRDGAYKSHEEV